jgi:hypothetical protein
MSSRQTSDARGVRPGLAFASSDERGHGVVQFVLAILAVLSGVLTWMLAAASLRRYRTLPGADWTEFVPGVGVGLVTVLLACMGVFAANVTRLRADVAARIAQSPQRPWLHVTQWNQGRIQDAPARQAAVALGAFAAMWNAVVIGVALLTRGRDDLRSDPTVMVFLGIFGMVGLGLVAGTVYMAVAGRRFGRAAFEMSAPPGVLGGWLRGNILLPEQVPGGIEARVSLVCRRDSSGSRRLSYDVWKAEATVMTASSVPIAFRMPFNLPESDLPDMPSKGAMRVSWLLSIRAALPGADYSAVFEVPVFPTDASDRSFVTGADGDRIPPAEAS